MASSLQETTGSQAIGDLSFLSPVISVTPIQIGFDPNRTTFRVVGNWGYAIKERVIVAKKSETAVSLQRANFGEAGMYPFALRAFKEIDKFHVVTIDGVTANNEKNYCYAFEIVLRGTKPVQFKTTGPLGSYASIATNFEGAGAFTCAYDSVFNEWFDPLGYTGNLVGDTKFPAMVVGGSAVPVYLKATLTPSIPSIVSGNFNDWWKTSWTLSISVINRNDNSTIVMIANNILTKPFYIPEAYLFSDYIKDLNYWNLNVAYEKENSAILGGAINGVEILTKDEENTIEKELYSNQTAKLAVTPKDVRKSFTDKYLFDYDDFTTNYWLYKAKEK